MITNTFSKKNRETRYIRCRYFAFAMAEKQPKRKRSEEHKLKKKDYDHERVKTQVSISVAFRRWRELHEMKGLKTDAVAADR